MLLAPKPPRNPFCWLDLFRKMGSERSHLQRQNDRSSAARTATKMGQCSSNVDHVNARRRSTLRRLVCDRWNAVTLLANQVERHACPESVQFASSPTCGLQFANRGHRVSSHRSMCRKVACEQRHCSQEHDDGSNGDWIVGADSIQQPGDK